VLSNYSDRIILAFSGISGCAANRICPIPITTKRYGFEPENEAPSRNTCRQGPARWRPSPQSSYPVPRLTGVAGSCAQAWPIKARAAPVCPPLSTAGRTTGGGPGSPPTESGRHGPFHCRASAAHRVTLASGNREKARRGRADRKYLLGTQCDRYDQSVVRARRGAPAADEGCANSKRPSHPPRFNEAAAALPRMSLGRRA
jgi:hypothetical protein